MPVHIYSKLLKKFQKDILLISTVLILTLLVNLPLFNIPFLYDDFDFLFNWHAIQNFNHIPSLLQGVTPAGHEGVYRPLRSIFYVLSYHFYGHNIFYYHIQELITYFLCIILTYLITQKMFSRRALSFLTALFFALLPIHIDNLANLTASFDTIGAVFFFLSFYLFQHYIGTEKKHSDYLLILSLLFSIAAYSTYEITFALPLVIFIYSFFKNHKLPLSIYISYLSTLISFLIIRTLLHIPSRGELLLNLPHKIASLLRHIVLAPLLSVLPLKIELPDLSSSGILLFSSAAQPAAARTVNYQFLPAIISIIILVTVITISIRFFLKRQINGFSLIWFYICMLPVVAITLQSYAFTSEGQTMWGKYSIIASFGVSLLLANWLLSLLKTKPGSSLLQYIKLLCITLIITIFLLNIVTNYNNLNNFRDPLPALLSQLNKQHENEEKHNDLGVVYAMYQKFPQSVLEFRKSLKINPSYSRARQNLQKLCQILQTFPDTRPQFQTLCPTSP